MPKHVDLTKKKFGRWTVLERADNQKRHIYYKCECKCGTIKNIRIDALKDGHSQSCGCLRKELLTKHGEWGTPTYRTWNHMLQRCNNPNNGRYKDWGGRGIVVCKRWLKFENFLKDMGERPGGLTIERIDNSLNYYKENCKWATLLEQNRNQRLQKTNKTGIAGVSWSERHQKYCVQIGANYKQYHIGLFADIEQAKIAREQAEQKYWNVNA